MLIVTANVFLPKPVGTTWNGIILVMDPERLIWQLEFQGFDGWNWCRFGGHNPVGNSSPIDIGYLRVRHSHGGTGCGTHLQELS